MENSNITISPFIYSILAMEQNLVGLNIQCILPRIILSLSVLNSV